MTSTKVRMTSRVPSRLAVLVLVGVAVAGCTAAAATQTPQSSESPSAAAAPTPSPSPASTPALPLPAGNWASIKWTKMAPSPSSLPSPDTKGSGWTILGWSRGWLAFDAIEGPTIGGQTSLTIDTRHSQDGLHWQAGGQIQWTGGGMGPTNVVEGPAGLLAFDREMLVCGSVSNTDSLVAVSVDGITWKSIKADALPPSIQNVSGGSTGYIATGTDGAFTSLDGMTWSKADLTGTAFKGVDGIENGVAFADGYVIAGETFGPTSDGCGAGPTLLTPSLWWSADGTSWTRDSIAGTVAGTEAKMEVFRLDDHRLLACESNPAAAAASWASTDGRTWKKAATVNLASGGIQFVSNGQRTVIVSNPGSSAVIQAFRDDLTLATLVQSGDVPNSDHMFGWIELGPNGLLQMDDLGNTYLGVPVAG